MSEPSAILRLEKVRKTFPGVVALNDVDFSLHPGEVHALLGENGAGKSTLIKVLTGVYARDGGAILLDGRPISPRSSADAQMLGISTVYQEVNLLPNLSVAQNIFLGREPRKFGLIQWRRVNRDAAELLKQFKLDIDVTAPLESYSVAVQQLVAIARGIAADARVLVLDEPTASLDSGEVAMLFDILRELKSRGMAIVFVTHFLDQVYALSDRITVLRNGTLQGEFATASLPRQQLVETMLGRELAQAEQQVASAHQTQEPEDQAATAMLSLRELATSAGIRDVNLSVAAGEAVGLAGLLGSGRSEVCRAVFGLDAITGGECQLRGKPVAFSRPAQAIAAGLALCPEDRKREGIIGPLSVRENIVIALQARKGWWKPISRQQQVALSEQAVRDMNIATSDIEKPVELLSGGNQQKVILGRWLAVQPSLLLLDEPTRGIDIGAHAEILKLIRDLCEQGMALLVTSSELEELVAFSNKVVVMRDRRQAAQLQGEDISEDNIMQAIAKG